MNPYAAPREDSDSGRSAATATPERGSFAWRVSITLASLGVVLFWGTNLGLGYLYREATRPPPLVPVAISGAAALSFLAHLVGGGVALAAPTRRRRWQGVGVNLAALLLLAVLLFFSLWGEHPT